MLLSYSAFAVLITSSAYFFLRFLDKKKIYNLPASSFLMGYSIFTRPYEGAAIFIMSFLFLFVFMMIKKFSFRKGILSLMFFGLPPLLFLTIILWYNQKVTGDYLQVPFQKYAKDDTIGFGSRSINDLTYVNYGLNEAWNKTSTIFRKVLTPGIFGNFYIGLIAYVFLGINFFKNFSSKKSYLLMLIILGFLLDFYHWVYSLDVWGLQLGYPYLLFIIPLIIILFVTSGWDKDKGYRYFFYGLFVLVLALIPFTYLRAYRNNASVNEKRNKLGLEYEKLDKEGSIIFLDKFLLFGESNFIMPNNAPLDSDPIVARDLGKDNQELMDMFPSKKVYILRDEDFVRIR